MGVFALPGMIPETQSKCLCARVWVNPPKIKKEIYIYIYSLCSEKRVGSKYFQWNYSLKKYVPFFLLCCTPLSGFAWSRSCHTRTCLCPETVTFPHSFWEHNQTKLGDTCLLNSSVTLRPTCTRRPDQQNQHNRPDPSWEWKSNLAPDSHHQPTCPPANRAPGLKPKSHRESLTVCTCRIRTWASRDQGQNRA